MQKYNEVTEEGYLTSDHDCTIDSLSCVMREAAITPNLFLPERNSIQILLDTSLYHNTCGNFIYTFSGWVSDKTVYYVVLI